MKIYLDEGIIIAPFSVPILVNIWDKYGQSIASMSQFNLLIGSFLVIF